MVSPKGGEGASFQNSLTSGEPITHFFYEYKGERSVEPFTMLDNGITLWHEHIYTNGVHDNSYLWQLAARVLDDCPDTPMYSRVEWLRYNITIGKLVPDQWDKSKPYPYKGLFISAIYLQEAERLCMHGDSSRVWHILVSAYYHLGLNTALSTRQNAARAAKIKHASISEKMRAMVFSALEKIKQDGSANSIESAKRQVVELVRERQHERPIKDWLAEFDTLIPRRTKSEQNNDKFARLQNMLGDWCLPSSPHPDIAEAFSHFSSKTRRPKSRIVKERTSDAGVPIDDTDYYMRLISFMEDGSALTVKLSKAPGEEVT
jgi:hypothetical protein